ncbi:MAG: formate/nitrite transporter family protein [Desulforhopalus sp.]
MRDDKEQDRQDEPTTERGFERQLEDKDYVPVIIKRSDETVRHPDDVLEKAITEGLEQINRPLLSLVLSSVGAGMILGFTAMAVAVMSTLTAPLEDPFTLRIATALVYPLGFVICIMSRTQLFTEHTATAVYPILSGKSEVKKLFRLWLLVILGNEIGAVASAWLLTLADEVVLAHDGYVMLGHHLVDQSISALLVSSVLAGWLMALGGWLVLVTSPAFSQMICIYIVTFLIGLGGLHHSIAGSVEMFTAILVSNEFTIIQGLRFVGLAILGNLIGGSVFVAGFNYSHIRKTQQI